MSEDNFKSELGVRFRPQEPPASADEVRTRHESNRAAWNEAAVRYSEDLTLTIQFIRDGRSNIHPIEKANLGDLASWCHTAIHLQCASGRDTLSLWNEGVARVIGVDISDRHIENARKLSDAVGAPAEWHRCDVLDVPVTLNGVADLVYTGRGCLCWLQDLTAWGQVIARLLKPGGVVHILDDHPLTWLFSMDTKDLTPSGFDYFRYAETSKGWPSSYVGELEIPVAEQTDKYERAWPLTAVFTALTDAGLVVERLGEHREGYWETFPNLDPKQRETLPLTFSMMARKSP